MGIFKPNLKSIGSNTLSLVPFYGPINIYIYFNSTLFYIYHIYFSTLLIYVISTLTYSIKNST